MQATLLSLLLMVSINELFISGQDVTILPSRPITTVPSPYINLMPGLPLLCGLEPETLTPSVNYTTRWILPDGTIVNSTSTGRFIISENLVSIEGRSVPGTVLVVTQLSYQDAGMYTCEGRSTASGASTQWAAASMELQLNLILLSNTSTVMTTMDDYAIALHCEVRAFIRPDSSFVWEGPGGQRISNGMGKHQITFSDGSPDAAANGGGLLVPSRVSTLTITNPESSDAGTYTCNVIGTSEAVTIELMVNGSVSTTDLLTSNADATDADTTDANTPDADTTDGKQRDSAVIIFGSIMALLTGLSVITAVVICCLIHTRNRSTINNDGGAESDQVYHDQIAVHGLDHDHGICTRSVQPDESTATRMDAIANDEISDDLTVERNIAYDTTIIQDNSAVDADTTVHH